MAPTLRIVTFPESDREFAADVQRAFEIVCQGAESAQKAVADLIVRLLPTYPRLAMRQQDGLASFEREPNVWYAYRDGYDFRRAENVRKGSTLDRVLGIAQPTRSLSSCAAAAAEATSDEGRPARSASLESSVTVLSSTSTFALNPANSPSSS